MNQVVWLFWIGIVRWESFWLGMDGSFGELNEFIGNSTNLLEIQQIYWKLNEFIGNSTNLLETQRIY
jgi:hypothetical protein